MTRLRGVWLIGLGLASLALYAWLYTHLTWLSSATPSYAELVHGLGGLLARSTDRDLATSQQAAQGHAEAAAQFSIAVTASFVLYLVAVRVGRGASGRGASWQGPGVSGRVAAVVVVVFAALLQLVGVLAPDMLSQDVFSYASYGRMLAVYGANPHIDVPASYPQDAYYGFLFWKFVPSFYGPLWTLMSAGLVTLAGDNVPLAVALFRGLEAGAAVAGTVVVLLVLRTIDPPRAVAGAIVFGWNPLLVLEGGLSGHNDVLMVALMALAVGLVVWRRGALACLALVAAGLIKFTALAILPLLGIYLLRQAPGWSARAGLLARCAGLCVPFAVLCVLPVWAGPATFAVGALGSGPDRYVNSLGEVALGELRAAYGESREDLAIPLQFRGWWYATHTETGLYPRRDDAAEPLAPIEQWQELLIVAPEAGGWMKMFDPASRQIGYVRPSNLGPIERPAWADADALILQLEAGPVGTASLQRANGEIRAIGWGAFVAAMCVGLVLGTRTLGGLLRTWSIVLLVLFYVTLSWFWPWYALWALPAAALLPRSVWSRLVVLVSWGVLLLYAGLGFEKTGLWYLQTYRALPAFGLPLLLWLGDSAVRGLFARASAHRRAGGRADTGTAPSGAGVPEPAPDDGVRPDATLRRRADLSELRERLRSRSRA